MISVRDDLRLLEGYHSPQVDVRVRLNTNESPEPPPAACRDAFAAELSRVDWHRYPDRSATELREAIAELHGVAPDQVFAANGSNEVLQTCCSPTPGRAGRWRRSSRRTSCTPTSPGSPVRRWSRATAAPTSRSIRPRSTGSSAGRARRGVPCSPNNPTGLVEPVERCATVRLGSGLVVVDEAYGQFSDWSALDLVAEDGRSS